MDGWETRRRREPGHDWCIVRLGLPGVLRGVVVDTAHFRGNYPESCSLEACAVEGYPAPEELLEAAWTEILPRSPLQGNAKNRFADRAGERPGHPPALQHLSRTAASPGCGSTARWSPDWARLARRGGEIDLAAVENGGLVLACSDMFFGNRHNLILPGPPLGMHDGWETRRRRGPGHDWAIVKLGARGTLHRVEVDTSHFKGNAPGSCSIEGCDAPGHGRAALRGGSALAGDPAAHSAAPAHPASVRRGRRGRAVHPRPAQHLSRRRRGPPAALRNPGRRPA